MNRIVILECTDGEYTRLSRQLIHVSLMYKNVHSDFPPSPDEVERISCPFSVAQVHVMLTYAITGSWECAGITFYTKYIITVPENLLGIFPLVSQAFALYDFFDLVIDRDRDRGIWCLFLSAFTYKATADRELIDGESAWQRFHKLIRRTTRTSWPDGFYEPGTLIPRHYVLAHEDVMKMS